MRKQTDDNANDDGSITNKEDDDGTGMKDKDKEEEEEEEEEAIETEAIESETIIDQQESQPRPTNSDSKASTLLHVAEAARAVNRPLNLTRDPLALAHLLKTKRSQRGRKSDPRMEVAVVAKLSNPALTLRQALVQGGFVFRPKHNPAGPLGLGGYDERRGGRPRKGRAPKGTANDLVDQDGEYWLHVVLVCLCIYIYMYMHIYILYNIYICIYNIYGFRLAVAFAS